jgi:uncharacterized membrane protein
MHKDRTTSGVKRVVIDLDADGNSIEHETSPTETETGAMKLRIGLIPVAMLRPAIAECVRKDHPDLPDTAVISERALAKYRLQHLADLLRAEHGELSELDRQVTESIAQQEIIAQDVDKQFEQRLSFGDKVADQVARFGGSWRFLISFAVVLAAWIALNAVFGGKAFDPFPFILLNLVLSCLAAVQAPIIMMSQRRQEERDRARADNDYRVNLKAELEIRYLHDKLDHLTTRQWDRLIEIQQMQIEILEEAKRR